MRVTTTMETMIIMGTMRANSFENCQYVATDYLDDRQAYTPSMFKVIKIGGSNQH